MKKIAILTIILSLFVFQTTFSSLLFNGKNLSKSYDDLKYEFSRTTTCSTNSCMALQKEKIMKLELSSYILAYKVGSEWKIETDSSKFHGIVKSYNPKLIIVGEGNVNINDREFSDKNFGIILQ